MASGFVKIAMDEFYSHNPNNLTGLVQRYWMMVEEDVAGKLNMIAKSAKSSTANASCEQIKLKSIKIASQLN